MQIPTVRQRPSWRATGWPGGRGCRTEGFLDVTDHALLSTYKIQDINLAYLRILTEERNHGNHFIRPWRTNGLAEEKHAIDPTLDPR